MTVGQNCFERNVDYAGENIAIQFDVESAADCQVACKNTRRCTHFTYAPADFSDAELRKQCMLKTTKSELVRGRGLVSGPVSCNGMG